jgi:hypothetical protein
MLIVGCRLGLSLVLLVHFKVQVVSDFCGLLERLASCLGAQLRDAPVLCALQVSITLVARTLAVKNKSPKDFKFLDTCIISPREQTWSVMLPRY